MATKNILKAVHQTANVKRIKTKIKKQKTLLRSERLKAARLSQEYKRVLKTMIKRVAAKNKNS